MDIFLLLITLFTLAYHFKLSEFRFMLIPFTSHLRFPHLIYIVLLKSVTAYVNQFKNELRGQMNKFYVKRKGTNHVSEQKCDFDV